MENGSDEKLIESIYNVAVDPQNFQKFLDRWESEFLHIPAAPKTDIEQINSNEVISNSVEDHFFRAYAILEMIEPQETGLDSLQEQLQADPLPSFLLSKQQKITMLNDRAKNLLDLYAGQELSQISFLADDFAKVSELLLSLDEVEPDKVLAIMQAQIIDNEVPIIFAITKLFNDEQNQEYLKFCAVYSLWNDDIGDMVKQTFSLTKAELEIAKKLVSGKKISEIAAEKNRSILTIRTHCKSLYRKTKLKTQVDLIKFFALLQSFEHQERGGLLEAQGNGLQLTTRNKTLIRDNGRKLYYEIYGPADGEPILFMHGIMNGTELPQNIIDYLHRHKLKFFAPHRPAFGMSDPFEGDDIIGAFTQDILALLDEENIQNCKIVGHSVGSYYAYHLGSRLSGRISKIRIIGGAVPFTKPAHISVLNKRQRVTAFTAKYTPQLLPFLLRGSAMQVKKYGAESLIDALYQDSEFDYELIKDPELREIVISGFEASFKHGVGSVVADGRYIFGDRWNAMIEACTMPIEIYHGADNQAVPLAQVQEFVDLHDKLAFEVIDGGQLIFYKFFEKTLKNL